MLALVTGDLLAVTRRALDSGLVRDPFCLLADRHGNQTSIALGLPAGGKLPTIEAVANAIAERVMPAMLELSARAYALVLPSLVGVLEGTGGPRDLAGQRLVPCWAVHVDSAPLMFPYNGPTVWLAVVDEDSGEVEEWGGPLRDTEAPFTELLHRAICPQDHALNI